MAAERKRIKVLFTIPNFDTAGSGKALLNIAGRLDRDKFEPHIVCMHDRGEFFNEVAQSGIPVHLLQYTSPMKPYWKGLWNCWKISQVLKTLAPDIIHSFHYASDYSEALTARMAGIKWIYTKKNMSWGGSSKNAWKIRSFLATHIIVQNTDMMKQFFQGSKKVSLIPRGVNVQKFISGSMDQELRTKYGVNEGDRIIICVANLVPIKGIEVLIDAFAQLASDFPAWKVWIVGDDNNEYGSWLHNKVDELALSSHIIFTGKQLQVKVLLDQAEIFVLPTLNKGRMEGSPVSLLEAMANGKIILGSEIPGIRDQLEALPNYLFAAGSALALKNKLRSVMRAEISVNQLEQEKFAKLASDFSIEKEVERHELTYLRIANG